MRRRLLFVTQQLPWPKDSGGNIRTYHLLAALTRQFDVVLCATSDGSPAAEAGERVMNELCASVRLVPDTKRSGALGQLRGVLASFMRGVPAVLLHNENPALREAVEAELASGGIDSVHINHLDTAAYFDLAHAPPSVIDTHNLLFEYYARRAEFESSAARRWICRREARLLATHELRILGAVRRVVVCSETERASLLERAPALDVSVVPNGVDCAEFAPVDAPPSGAGFDLVFVGDLAYGPNSDAALRFVREVLPLVQRTRPGARFLTVGKNPPAELVALGSSRDDIVVTGYVDDVRDWVHGAAVYVVPIRYGSGTRLKVLEAFALGMPTVSTSIGAEGIDTHDGEDILLRDEPDDMARGILELLEDRDLAACLGANARRNAVAHYDWSQLGEQLAQVHARLSE